MTIAFAELRVKLNCENYNFGEFNKNILKKAVDEINDLTDIVVDFALQKTGRSVSHIAFFIDKKNFSMLLDAEKKISDILDPPQISLFDT